MGSIKNGFVRPDFIHKDTLERIRMASQNRIYTYTFPTLFCWAEDEDYKVYFEKDAFLVKNGARGQNAYLGPCGTEEGKKKLVEALLEEESPVFYFLGEDDVAFLDRCFPGRFTFEECRNDFPYLYNRTEQIKMDGKAFKHLRHTVNQCESAYHWETEPITGDRVDRVLDINLKWQQKEEKDIVDLHAAECAAKNFDRLSLWGMFFRADGVDVAYVMGSFITPERFDVNFSKVLLPGSDCYIKWRLYKELPSGVLTVDSEEDMGIEGLRKHKLLRKPTRIAPMWKGTYSL